MYTYLSDYYVLYVLYAGYLGKNCVDSPVWSIHTCCRDQEVASTVWKLEVLYFGLPN